VEVNRTPSGEPKTKPTHGVRPRRVFSFPLKNPVGAEEGTSTAARLVLDSRGEPDRRDPLFEKIWSKKRWQFYTSSDQPFGLANGGWGGLGCRGKEKNRKKPSRRELEEKPDFCNEDVEPFSALK